MRGQVSYVSNDESFTNEQMNAGSLSAVGSDLSYDGMRNNLQKIKRSKLKVHPDKVMTLSEWLQKYHMQEDLQNLFVNMDIAMKYIHDQGFYIESFALDRIKLLNDSIRLIRFENLAPFPNDITQQKELVRNNIFLSAVLQIGVYANCIQYFNTDTMQFLKENFNQFSMFLPQEDVPYYKGVIERGASVYYSAFVGERKKRELKELDKQLSGVDGGVSSRGKVLVKSNGLAELSAEDLIPHNEKENGVIYKDLSKKEAAFARALIYPIMILIFGLTILLLSYLLQ
jgi:hypothetical protein